MIQSRTCLLLLFVYAAEGFLTLTKRTFCLSAIQLDSSKDIDLPPTFQVVDDDGDSSNSSPYTPPDFTVEAGGDDEVARAPKTKTRVIKPPKVAVVQDEQEDPYSEKISASPRRPKRPKRKNQVANMAGTNWMEKNAQFSGQSEPEVEDKDVPTEKRSRPRATSPDAPARETSSAAQASSQSKSFRQDFRGTRVFVQGIPPRTSWQELKDHFKVAGDVVFASVSVNPETGETKGHGIVQFETTSMAVNAIQVMRNHQLNGSPLFVREDVQERSADAQFRSVPKGPTPPTKWKCANEDNTEHMSDMELSAIRTLIKSRDFARRQRRYEESDRIRDELKENHGVFVDDRLHMWWTAIEGNKVPQSIKEIKGDGRWKLEPWRMIPTTEENDACVNPELVEGLLKQRDISRREKDFRTADALLEEARHSPDGELQLRVHDESRTWRIWTEAPPPGQVEHRSPRERTVSRDPVELRKLAAEECIDIVTEHAPDKIGEINMVLSKFPGREFSVLKRLKNQYL